MKEIVAKLLEELADLSSLSGENSFKTRSYRKAANSIRYTNPEVLTGAKEATVASAVKALQDIDGVGKGIAEKIKAILDTGTCPKLEDLRKENKDLVPLLQVHGIGPVTALKLFNDYGPLDRNGLKALVQRGIITDKRIIDGLNTSHERILRSQAQTIVQKIQHKLKSVIEIRDVTPCGSYRRELETVGDLDFVVCVQGSLEACIVACKNTLDNLGECGKSKISGSVDGVQVDFRFVEPLNYGAMILYFTGSRDFNILLRRKAIAKGWSLNEWALTQKTKVIASRTEEEIFEALGMEPVEPKDRR